eukprot:3766718-Prymnesium_polylepis.1
MPAADARTREELALGVLDLARRPEALEALGHAVLVVRAARVALVARRRAVGVGRAGARRPLVRAPAAALELGATARRRDERTRVDALASARLAARLVVGRALAARRRALARGLTSARGGAPAAARGQLGAAAHVDRRLAQLDRRDVQPAHRHRRGDQQQAGRHLRLSPT